jgi:hypothetical protein
MRKITLFIMLALFGLSVKAQWVEMTTDDVSANFLVAKSGTIYAGTQDSGIYKSADNGHTWTVQGLLGNNVSSIAFGTGSNMFAGDYSAGVYFYNGTTWAAVNTGLQCDSVNSVAVIGNNLFAGTFYGAYLSTNNGTSWTATSFPDTDGVWTFAVNGTNLLAASSDNVFMTTNSGTSWNDWVGPDSLQYTIESFAINGSNIFAASNYGVYLSTNGGTSFIAQANSNFTPSLYPAIVANGTSNLILGDDLGNAYLSTDNGGSWTDFNDGFETGTFSTISSLAICGQYIYAATNEGIWRRPLTDITSIKNINAINNFVVYPNPASEAITVDSQQPLVNSVEIYNMLGDEMYSTTNNKPQTTNEINISSFAKGVYFIKVNTNKGSVVKKFIKE